MNDEFQEFMKEHHEFEIYRWWQGRWIFFFSREGVVEISKLMYL